MTSGLEYADATNHDHIGRVLGMTTGAVTAGSVVSLQSIAEMVEPLWNWDISKLVYLRENGLLTQTPPAAPDYAFCMVIGFPKSPTSLILNPGNAIILN
jgi:hypothetical protein